MNEAPLNIYADDFEAIELIKKLPQIPFEPFNGLSILEFIDKHTVGKDFGIVFPYQREFYVIYKYGLKSDSGIILIKALFENSLYLRMYFDKVDKSVFPNEQIFHQMCVEFTTWRQHFKLNI
ncbi:MAG: hypothetical protein RIB71_16110 [Imperialibacter sp.]|uniref:hypothetical protein n=1 Tax=Imperialibacter sp. TaxID=2038411 RepID=UPI0032F02F3E